MSLRVDFEIFSRFSQRERLNKFIPRYHPIRLLGSPSAGDILNANGDELERFAAAGRVELVLVHKSLNMELPQHESL